LQAFFAESFGLCFFFAYFELFHPALDVFASLRQRSLVFDVITRQPRLNLVAEALEILDLRLEISLMLLLLVGIVGAVELQEGVYSGKKSSYFL
jgi:hypothetical protein